MYRPLIRAQGERGPPTDAPDQHVFSESAGFSIPVGIMQLVDLPLLGVWFGVAGGLLLGPTHWSWARRVAW